MIEVSNATERQTHRRWKPSLSNLIFFAISIALGLFFWRIVQDWYVGALAAISFWIILGLAAQVRDIWASYRSSGVLTSDERWGWRFALAWRFAICFLMGVYCLLRLLIYFHFLAADDGPDFVYISSQEMWDTVLMVSLIAAIAGSLGVGRKVWRRPWSWGIAIFRGFIAGFLFLMLLQDRLLVPYLVHITIVGILLAQPIQFSTDVAYTSSFARISQFYDIATAGAISLIVSCILLWQLSVRWRAAWRHRVCLGIMLTVSLTFMILLTARIALFEFPTISPLIAANMRVPAPLQLAAASVLIIFLTTAVARRWSETPPVGIVPRIAVWRRDEGRYYHERLSLILILGGIALARWIEVAVGLAEMWYGMNMQLFPISFWGTIGSFLTFPTVCLSLALLLLVVHVTFSKRSIPPYVVGTERPRLSPGIFLIVWFSALTIVLCSVPTFAAWHFASFLRSGFFPK